MEGNTSGKLKMEDDLNLFCKQKTTSHLLLNGRQSILFQMEDDIEDDLIFLAKSIYSQSVGCANPPSGLNFISASI